MAGREREEREKRAEMRRDASLRDMRLQVLLTFLEYRGRGETSRQAWQSVLDEQFEMRMPLTPYRSFPPQQVRRPPTTNETLSVSSARLSLAQGNFFFLFFFLRTC